MYISGSDIRFWHRSEENPGKMFVKIATITLVAFVATAQGEQVWNTLLTKWSESTTDCWYELPQNISAAEDEGWLEIDNASDLDDIIGMGYYGDPRFTVLYNTTTNNATGFEICILVEDEESQGVTLDYTESPYIVVKELGVTMCYASTIYFIEDIEADTRVIKTLLKDGTYEYIPSKVAEIRSQDIYEEKGCIPTMGDHFYKLNASSTIETWNPWAVITIDGVNVNSVVYNGVGMMSVVNDRNWTETVTRETLVALVPTTATWLKDDMADFGYMSIHSFFNDPREFICSDIGLADGADGTSLG